MLSLGLSLLGIGKNIMAWLSATFGWLFKRWYRVAIAALCAVVVVLTFVNISLRGQVLHWKERHAYEVSAHIATKVNYANAQKVAADMNKKQVEVTENKRKEIANAKDAEIRSSIDRAVADARRVWAAKAAKGFASGSSASEVATRPVDPNGASGMSILDESDVRICTINTLKAKGWQDFYEGLRASE